MMQDFVREDLRIEFPPEYLLTIAVWLRPRQTLYRTTLEALGRPDFLMRQGAGDELSIKDISCKGMMLRVGSAFNETDFDPGTTGLFLYLQLRDPWGESLLQQLSLFLYCRVAMRRSDAEGTLLGLEFLRQGLGSSFEKSLDFLNVEKYGVDDVQRWRNDLLRQCLPQATPPQLGLNVDRLLEELDAVLSASRENRSKSGGL
jgi:hypothetical protein